jgi:hypothetical protein
VIGHEPRIWRSEEIALIEDIAAAVVTEITLRTYELPAAPPSGTARPAR